MYCGREEGSAAFQRSFLQPFPEQILSQRYLQVIKKAGLTCKLAREKRTGAGYGKGVSGGKW